MSAPTQLHDLQEKLAQASQEVSPDQHVPAELHSLVHSYLATLLALSEALETACPAVGGPHQQRLGRLRTRLSFDSKKEAIEASAGVVRAELRDFAAKSSEHIAVTTGEWKRASEEICHLGMDMIKRQRFYATRMREIAGKLENGNAASTDELRRRAWTTMRSPF